MKKHMKRAPVLLSVLFLLLLCALAACGARSTQADAETVQGKISGLSDLAGLTAGIVTGTPQEEFISAAIPDCEFLYFDSFTDDAAALRQRKIDFFTYSITSFAWMQEEYPEFYALTDDVLYTFDIGAIFPMTEQGQALQAQYNEYLAGITADGTLQELRDTWLYPGDVPEIEIPSEGENGVLEFATCSSNKPLSYIYDGRHVGFDVAIAAGFCREYGYGLHINDLSFASMLTGITTGKYDLAAGQIGYTEERAEKVLYSDIYCQQEMVPVILEEDYAGDGLAYSSIEDLRSASGGVVTGTIFGELLEENGFTGSIEYYNNVPDMAAALESGKIDFFTCDYPLCARYAAEYDDLAVLPEQLKQEDYYYAFGQDRDDLRQEFNTWLAQAKEDGLLDELNSRWILESAEEPADLSGLTGENGTLHIGISYTELPGAYYIDSQPAGYNIDLIANFCRDRGYGIEFVDLDSSATITALESGKIDIAVTFLSYTEERAEKVLYSDSIYQGGVAFAVRRTDTGSDGDGLAARLAKVKDSFQKSFVQEHRWKLVLQGLWVTLQITVLGFAAANLVGALFCAFAMSRSRFLRGVSGFFNWLMQGTPMVVILMILYYVVLGKADIAGLWVAVLGFGLNTGAYLAQTFQGAISGVDRGQTEASLALGMTKARAFFGIVLPQAVRSMTPAYFSQIISLMKGTAIVGYIAVADLTKVGDIIRSSTYEAFFPLLAIAAIYLLITSVILGLLKLVQKKLGRKLPPKTSKGGTAK